MSLIQKAITRLYLGESQQEVSNRIEGQSTKIINMLTDITSGVKRRNPTTLVKDNLGVSDRVHFIHSYNHGVDEEYIFLIDGLSSTLRIFDSAGNEKTLIVDAGVSSYLTSTLANQDSFRALTVGDTTFIVNTTKVCSMSSVRDGRFEQNYEHPFYWISKSYDNGSGTGYDYFLMGQSTNSVRSTNGASQLATALGTEWEAKGSIVFSKAVRNSSYNFTWSDSYGSQASEGFHGTAQKLADLPNDMAGFEDTYEIILEVTGTDTNNFTNFWVKFIDGVWKETRKPYMQNTIDNTTMPIKVIRQSDGTFRASFIDYSKRTVGDENTALEPSFIGKTIKDVFFFKNRLCFVSNENVIMSEVGNYYNFFPTTVSDVLDSDPIDFSVDSTDVSILNYAVPFSNQVLLMSESSQFRLQSDAVLSPNNVSVSISTNYNSVTNVRPIGLASSLFFLSKGVNGMSLREYFVDTQSSTNIATDVTGHVSKLLPNNIINMVGNTNENIIFILSSDKPNTLFVYKFYTNGNERLQTAWSTWEFEGSIKNITILDNRLYLLIKRGLVINLEKIDYSSNANVSSYLDNGSIPYESSLTLSEIVLKDANGKLIQSAKAPLLYKTFQLKSKEGSKYKVRINHKIRDRVVEKFALSDHKFLLQGKTSETELTIASSDDAPLEFHTATIELNYNLRAKVV